MTMTTADLAQSMMGRWVLELSAEAAQFHR